MDRIVRLHQVGVRYPGGREALSEVNLWLAPGSFHFLLGPSGAGKSTLLRLLHLGLIPTTGQVELFGREVTRLPRRERAALRRRIGVVFQDFALLDHMSVLDNVALPLRVAGLAESEVHARAAEMLEWVGLGEQMSAAPAVLSAGEMQRVAIARAVVAGPEILIADEPTGNVDDATADRLMRLFVALNRSGTTVLVATHNERLAGRFALPRLGIENGVLRMQSPTQRAGIQ